MTFLPQIVVSYQTLAILNTVIFIVLLLSLELTSPAMRKHYRVRYCLAILVLGIFTGIGTTLKY
jgi:hypothetical protein